MTYGEVVTTILDYAGQGSGGDFEKLVKRLVNGVYYRVLESGKVPQALREFTLTTVAGTSKYGLPLYVRRVLNIEDPTTPRFVYEETARSFDKGYPGTTESGTPSFAYPLGVYGVQKQPVTSGSLTIVSSEGYSVDGGSNYKVRVTGFRQLTYSNFDGGLVTELVTMGSTADPTYTSYSYKAGWGVERIVKEPASGYSFTGILEVCDYNGGEYPGNVLAVIPPTWMSPEYLWIEFHPIPDAAITYTIRSEMRKPPLVNTGDWPEFAAEYHDLLVFGVTMDLLPSLGKPEIGDRHRATYVKMLEALQRSNQKRPAGIRRFREVQSLAGPAQRPERPLIQGVDFGLVP